MPPAEDELLAQYGRVQPYGTVARGDGSERCSVCGTRDSTASYYVWCPGPTPVCSYAHAERLLTQRR